MRVRVATYNLAGFRFGIEPAAAALLQGSAGPLAHIALLQECGSRTALRRFAKLLAGETVSTHRPFNRVRNAVLYRPPWKLRAPAMIREHPPMGATNRRGLIVAPLQSSGLRVNAVAAHLGLLPDERRRHAAQMVEFVGQLEGPTILGADLNEGPRDATVRIIEGRLREAFRTSGYAPGDTYPAHGPIVRIDYLFGSEDVKIVRAWTGVGPAVERGSDHLPVFAEVEVG